MRIYQLMLILTILAICTTAGLTKQENRDGLEIILYDKVKSHAKSLNEDLSEFLQENTILRKKKSMCGALGGKFYSISYYFYFKNILIQALIN